MGLKAMRLSYASLFPDQVKQIWCKRKRLPRQNAYQLPAGDYCIYDLYPLSGIAEPDIFFTVESRKDQALTATLRCLLYGDKAEVMLSPEHLQTAYSPSICQLVQDLLNQDAPLRRLLMQRKQEVQAACQTISLASDSPESSLLSETAIRKLAGALEQVLQAREPELFEAHLDQLLQDLRLALMNSFQVQYGASDAQP